jgi:hypothetical protein
MTGELNQHFFLLAGICYLISLIVSFMLEYELPCSLCIYLFNMLSSDPPLYMVIAQKLYIYAMFKIFGCAHHLFTLQKIVVVKFRCFSNSKL